ncbi:MAG: glycosyltransferase family 4 protein [Candidatus Omnitrophica bacterium]|nr:glycosyltransferase family 4 protein [Candidatus Omnitrophota bacterium]
MNIIIPITKLKKTGGVERYVFEITKCFLNNKHVDDVYIITSDIDYESIPKEFLNRVKIVKTKSKGRFFMIEGTIVARKLKKKLKNAVIFTQQGTTLGGDVVIEHACHLASIFELNKRIFSKFLRLIYPPHFIAYAVEFYNHNKALKSIAISNKIKRDLEKYVLIPSSKIKTVYSGINSKEFSKNEKSRKEIRKNLKLSDKFVMILVANEFKRKNLITILKAISILKNKDLVLLVAGKDNPAKYKAKANELGILDKIIFLGSVRNIQDYFSAADVFVYPTLYGPFDLVVLESMSIGIPIITSNEKFNGVAEIIKDTKNGILIKNPTDSEELAKKIEMLYKNPSLRNKISKEAIKTAKLFTWQKTADNIIKVFRECLKK